MLHIQITRQDAKLEISTTKPQLQLTTTPPRIELSTDAAKLDIHHTNGHFEIDQSPCRASYGLLSPTAFAEDRAQRGRQTAMETIARIAEDGDRLANIESGENAVVELAADSNIPEPVEVGITPIDPPIIQYQPGTLDIQATRPQVDLTLERGTVQTNLIRGTVTGQMIQYPSIQISTTGSRVNFLA